jgi:hypothetical protein
VLFTIPFASCAELDLDSWVADCDGHFLAWFYVLTWENVESFDVRMNLVTGELGGWCMCMRKVGE